MKKKAQKKPQGSEHQPFIFLFMSLPIVACLVYYFANLQLSQFTSAANVGSTPKFTYFSARGISEPIRLLLKDADVKYIQNDLGMSVNGVPPADFTALKASGVLDYGQVPLWEEDGLQLVQSFAIIRHLARKYGYNGKNEIEEAKIDSIAEGCKDFTAAIRKVMSAPAEQKVEVWKNTTTIDIPKWLGFFEKLLKKSEAGYFVGNKISYADFFVVSITEEIRGANLGLENYPLLSEHLTKVLARPNIAKYRNLKYITSWHHFYA
eukprot:Phypoly_transcript_11008.p1 GENE.Phypoly_transcript_11008~~Phypoly_transcript_11008.p1  ORF type:complete len:275 (+),score=39.82 Phypoly_transcript_11008:36-827(+)